MAAPALGIDFGSSYSCVAVFRCGKVEVIENDHGNRTTPSYVSFTDTECLIGDDAKNRQTRNPENTIFGIKSVMGCKFKDVKTQSNGGHFPFTVINDRNKPAIKVKYKNEDVTITPEMICTLILTKLKEITEAYLGQKATNVVITVPNYFNLQQRHTIKDAATEAGFKVLRIGRETSASALAYAINNQIGCQNVILFDMGYDKTDVSVITIEDGIVEVVATSGDANVGGRNFDKRMVNHFILEFKIKYNKDITSSKRAVSRLYKACEIAKKTLSSSNRATVELDCLYDGIDYFTSITRSRFEELNADLFLMVMEPVRQCFRTSKLSKDCINKILLIGGSTRMPKVQGLLQEFFNGMKPSMSLNADEAVASGAAVHAAILSGDRSQEVQNLLLLDVTNFCLGIETAGGKIASIVETNTTIPTQKTHTFSTVKDNQPTVAIRVYEGDSKLAEKNNFLGSFELSRITPAPCGVPQIEITFSIEANYEIVVSAVDKSSGIEKSIRLTDDLASPTVLPPDDGGTERNLPVLESLNTSDQMESALGIDFGTTYSCLGVFRNGDVEILTNDYGNRTTASFVTFNGSEFVVGDAAKAMESMASVNCIFDVKRLLGQRFDDADIQSYIKDWPFTVISDSGKLKIKAVGGSKTLFPEEVITIILTKMKHMADAYLRKETSNAIIAVPAYFNFSQRHTIKEAGTAAGFNVIKIINETSASGFAYAFAEKIQSNKNLLMFDLGSGKLEVSALEIKDMTIHVISTSSNAHLGGNDFDQRMVDHFIKEFQFRYKKDLSKSQRAVLRLHRACETAKRTLSSSNHASIELDCLIDGIDLNTGISRDRFEEMNADLFHCVIKNVINCLIQSKMSKKDIHEIILVGGSTRIPKIQEILQKFFYGKDINRSLHADEAVAYGAAVQAMMLDNDLSGRIRRLMLLEGTPSSIGIESAGGLMNPIVSKNSTFPTKKTQTFSTLLDYQRSVLIRVYEGESDNVQENNFLGSFKLSGIPPAPRGVPLIEITVEVDANYGVTVFAVEKVTNIKEKMSIRNGSVPPTRHPYEDEQTQMCVPVHNNSTDNATERTVPLNLNEPETLFVGIDIGTTYSCIGVFKHGKFEIITNDQGYKTTPSCVTVTDKQCLVGDDAKITEAMPGAISLFGTKRLIGRNIDDVLINAKYWPFTCSNVGGKPRIMVKNRNVEKLFSPEEITLMTLTRMKELVDVSFGKKTLNVVIAVPAYFNTHQRQMVTQAGMKAGLNVLQIMNEPSAAAMAYTFDRKVRESKNILVFDIGGGKTEVSIVKISCNMAEVISSSSNAEVGGEDFDSRMLEHFIQVFKQRYNKDMSNDIRAVRRLRTACEQAKIYLSSDTRTSIELSCLYEDVNFLECITREQFEDMNADLFLSALKTVEASLNASNMSKNCIHEVLFIGGSSCIPKIQKLLQDYLGGKELNRWLCVDEAVAYGAAVQAAVVSGVVQNMVLKEVTPHSVGIETAGGVMYPIIKRNTTMPVKQTQTFTTFQNDQSSILIKVFEGENTWTKYNNFLGMFELSGIPPSSGGKPRIEVTFDIDANFQVDVNAVNRANNVRKTIKITNQNACPQRDPVEDDEKRMCIPFFM